jgi:hypothetical protein
MIKPFRLTDSTLTVFLINVHAHLIFFVSILISKKSSLPYTFYWGDCGWNSLEQRVLSRVGRNVSTSKIPCIIYIGNEKMHFSPLSYNVPFYYLKKNVIFLSVEYLCSWGMQTSCDCNITWDCYKRQPTGLLTTCYISISTWK